MNLVASWHVGRVRGMPGEPGAQLTLADTPMRKDKLDLTLLSGWWLSVTENSGQGCPVDLKCNYFFSELFILE